MTKKSKTERRSPNLSPIALLRPRLDGLIQNPAWLQRGTDSALADLDTVTKEILPSGYLPVVLRAIADSDPANREPLLTLLRSWLNQQQRITELQSLVEQNTLTGTSLQVAFACLQGVNLNLVTKQASAFYKAFYGDDDFGSQAFLIIFWYTNHQKSRVSGLNFLRDFNPPWEGAIKDTFQFPQRSPQDGVRQYVDRMRQGPINIREIDPVEAKQLMIESFRCNQAQSIRPSRDTISLRNVILDRVFTLPDSEETPQFTIDELDSIFSTGKTADEIMIYEKTVGRRVRMDDGKELLVIGGGDDDW